jgi:methylaspartate mutase sigma subunit
VSAAVGVDTRDGVPEASRGRVVVAGGSSDSHTWNLVFLQLLIEEFGYEVVNLGPCVPDDLVVESCREQQPTMLVMSSVNGHGSVDCERTIRKLRAEGDLAELPAVLGGKLGIAGPQSSAKLRELVDAGFDAVFEDGPQGLNSFSRVLETLPSRARAALPVGTALQTRTGLTE